jgi:hypothetical protein
VALYASMEWPGHARWDALLPGLDNQIRLANLRTHRRTRVSSCTLRTPRPTHIVYVVEDIKGESLRVLDSVDELLSHGPRERTSSAHSTATAHLGEIVGVLDRMHENLNIRRCRVQEADRLVQNVHRLVQFLSLQ